MIPLIIMKMKKWGWKNIGAGILTSLIILFIDRSIVRNILTQLDYLFFIFFPVFSSFVFLIAMNENHMNVLKNIFDYFDLGAEIDNYHFLKNVMKNNKLK